MLVPGNYIIVRVRIQGSVRRERRARRLRTLHTATRSAAANSAPAAAELHGRVAGIVGVFAIGEGRLWAI